MKKILIPYDFTETSKSALSYGVEIAKYLSANLVLLHISQVPVISSEFGMEAYSITEIFNDHNKAIQKIAEEIGLQEPLINDIEYHCEMGSDAEVIIEFSKVHDIDLVISGIGGHGSAFMKNIVGSTSVAVARHIDNPLIIVPPNASYKKIQNIAYACDYNKDLLDSSSLIKVKYINTLFDATLHILHVIPENHELNAKESLIDNYVEQNLENVCHKTYIISENSVADGLLNFIHHHEIDMVIVEPKKHSMLHKFFTFSTTNAMAFYSPVPVLTIHG
jgi:nucleotide-binding universal stress UspA family protein